MPSSYTPNLGIELPADGELDGVWGDVVNDNMEILDRTTNGSVSLSLSGTSSTLTTSDGVLSDGQFKVLVLAGTPSGTHTITISPDDAQKVYFVRNTTAESVVFTQGSGGNVTIGTNDSAIIYANGGGGSAAVLNLSGVTATTAELNILDGVTASTAELNILDGVTATTAELNILDGVTATAAELNQLDTNTFTSDITIPDKIIHADDTNTSIRFPAADTVTVETDGAERMRINSAGNVGIGTSAPDTMLDVATGLPRGFTLGGNSGGVGRTNSTTKIGRITVPHYTNAELPFAMISGAANPTENVVEIGTNTSTLNAASRLSFYTGATITGGTLASERMRIDSAGRVGIGTTSPAEQLHITGNLRVGSAVLATPSGSAPMYTCRAWVNFNGTGTVAIRASGNVSSITDNGNGDYTVNFTTAMPDANYAATCLGSTTSGGAATNGIYTTEVLAAGPALNRTTSAFRFFTLSSGLALTDAFSVNVAVFR